MPPRIDQIRTRQAEIKTGLDALEALEETTEEDQLRTDALLPATSPAAPARSSRPGTSATRSPTWSRSVTA
jgi:hypothetical protein